MKIQAPVVLLIGLLAMSFANEASASLSATYLTGDDIPVSAASYTASGEVDFTLGFTPTTGTELMVVENTGLGFITGEFSNLGQGDSVLLINGTQVYEFVANYYGGSGNDLVLVWKWTEAWAWGRNDDSELGDGTTVDRSAPVMVAGGGVLQGKTLISASAMNRSTVTLSSDGTIAAWGRNFFGQLGDGTTTGRASPVAVNQTGVLAGKTVISVAAGHIHVVALCSDGTLAAWGSSSNGLLGDGTFANGITPVLVDQTGVLAGKTVVSVVAGALHNVALCSDGTLAAWGYNGFGALGDGTNTTRLVPALVDQTGVLAGKTVVEVAVGVGHTVVRCSDGTLAAWGYNDGQLGDGTTTWTNAPVLVDQTGVLSGKTPISLGAGEVHTVVLCSDGTLAAWGQDEYGQLGESVAEVDRTIPVLVDQSGVLAGKTVISVSAGDFHNVVKCSDGTLAAWGRNQYLQIGLVSAVAERHVPVVVNQGATLAGKTKTSLNSGTSHNFVIAANPMTILASAVVDTAVDENDGAATGGISLRDAINEVVSGGSITFDPALNDATIFLTNGQLLMDKDLTIDASALAKGITIDAANHRVIQVDSGVTGVLNNLTITDGTTQDGQDAPNGQGDISGGNALHGGGIHNSGDLTLVTCTLSGNTTGEGGRGGGFGGFGGSGGNGGHGGGIFNNAGASLSMTHCTIAGNTTGPGGEGGNGFFDDGDGGDGGNGSGIYNNLGGSITLVHCTVAGNSTGGGGFDGGNGFPGQKGSGGGMFDRGTLELNNSVIASNGLGNQGSPGLGPDLVKNSGTFTGTGINFLGNLADSGQSASGTLLTGNAMLSPLSNHGGGTHTKVPLAGSPLIDPVGAASTSPFATDQRGLARVVNGLVDIGAVEYFPLILNGTLIAGANTVEFLSLGSDPLADSTASIDGDILTTRILILVGQGILPNVPGVTFGSNTLVSVSIDMTTGITTLVGGQYSLSTPDTVTVANVKFLHAPILLSAAGLSANEITVRFPAGFGIGTTAGSRRMLGQYTFVPGGNPDFLFDDSLAPTTASFTIPCAYAAVESVPLRLSGGAVTWVVAEGKFVVPTGGAAYDHAVEAATLKADQQAGLLANIAAGNRRTNDGYLRNTTTAGYEVFASAGGGALLSGSANIPDGSYNPHFPSGAFVSASQFAPDGSITWTTTGPGTGGALTSDGAARQDYSVKVDGDPCSGALLQGSEVLGITPTGGILTITAGGGVRADGAISTIISNPGGPIRWGRRDATTHGWKINGGTTGSFYAPGYAMPGASAFGGRAALALLLTGRGQPGNAGYVETPGTPEYEAGLADYAGMNLRISQNVGTTCTQLPGGAANPVTYPLKPCSKYVIRAGGITGRHEASAGALGLVSLWGFQTQFHEIAATFVDSNIADSLSRAGLHVGDGSGPADFDLELDHVKFGGTGELRSAEIAPSSPPVSLAYWGVDIQPLTCLFKFPTDGTVNGQPCENRDSGFPLLGVSCETAFFREPLLGELGFKPSGELISGGDPLAVGTGVDSRLRVPSQIRIKTHEELLAYTLTPVTGAVFNNWADPQKPAAGFLSLAGKLDLPFFEDASVHVHISPQRADALYIMNEWTDSNGKSAFTDTDFDDANRGWPTGPSLEDFRSPDITDTVNPYHPRVIRSWKGLDLNFSVHWEPLRRQFVVVKLEDGSLPTQHVFILDVETELRTLTPNVADIAFGLQPGGLPVLSTKRLQADVTGGIDRIGDAIKEGVRSAGNAAYQITDLTDGIEAVDELLDFNPQVVFEPALDAALPEAIIDSLYDTLKSRYEDTGEGLDTLCTRLNQAQGGLPSFQGQISVQLNLLGELDGASAALAQVIEPRLDRVDRGIDALLDLVEKDPTSQGRDVVKSIILQIFEDQPYDGLAGQTLQAIFDGIAGQLNDIVDQEVPKSEATLAYVERILLELKARVQQIRDQVTNGESMMLRLSAEASVGVDPFGPLAQTVVDNLCTFLQAQLDPGRVLLEQRPEELKALIRQTIKDQFVAEVLVARLRAIIREVGTQVHETLNASLDAILGVVNRVTEQVIAIARETVGGLPVIATIERPFDNITALKAVSVTGHARIIGDTVDRVRLDGKYEMNAGTEGDAMTFHGWLEVKNVNTRSPGSSCHLVGAEGVEIKLGATAPLYGLGFKDGAKPSEDDDPTENPPPTGTLELLFALDSNNALIGADGSLDVTGPLTFGVIEVEQVSLGLGFGGCNYLYGKANGKYNGKEAEATVFFGQHNDLPSLELMPETIENGIGNLAGREVIGIYVHAAAWFSLNEAFGLPDSCLFQAQGKLGGGFFGLHRPDAGPGQPALTTVGIITDLGVRAEILCLVTGKGEVLLVGAADFPDEGNLSQSLAAGTFRLDGQLRVTGKIGNCKIKCYKKHKNFHVHGTAGPDGIDLSFD